MTAVRSKPVTCEARIWRGRFDSEALDLAAWCGGKADISSAGGSADAVPDLAVPTVDGVVHPAPGDWIVCTPDGRVQVMKPDDFDRVFESDDPADNHTPDEQARYQRAKARFFTASEHPPVVALRDTIIALGMLIDEHVPPGRNQSIAYTALEDVQMRGNRGIFAPEGLR